MGTYVYKSDLLKGYSEEREFIKERKSTYEATCDYVKGQSVKIKSTCTPPHLAMRYNKVECKYITSDGKCSGNDNYRCLHTYNDDDNSDNEHYDFIPSGSVNPITVEKLKSYPDLLGNIPTIPYELTSGRSLRRANIQGHDIYF